MQTDNLGNSTTYDYYPDLLNTLSLGKAFLPQTHNFVKSATLTSGGSSETVTHFYTFASSNRLVKDSTYTSGVDVIAIKSSTYQISSGKRKAQRQPMMKWLSTPD